MQKIVFTVKEDICAANGKDEANKADLLRVMAHYGTLEDYAQETAKEMAKYQATINNLTNQLNAIKDQDLTADEITIVKCLRGIKTAITADYAVQIEHRDKLLSELKSQYDQTVEKIKAIIG